MLGLSPNSYNPEDCFIFHPNLPSQNDIKISSLQQLLKKEWVLRQNLTDISDECSDCIFKVEEYE
jgi:hypothetical protein